MMFKFLRKTALWILLAPCAIWGAGLASNQLVLNANHDKFPVMWNDYKIDEYRTLLIKATADEDEDVAQKANSDLYALDREGFLDDTHVIMSSKTHLNWLADVFDLHTATYSIGDALLYLGGLLLGYAPFIWIFAMVNKLRKT
jgi:hypothetical protein